MKWKACGRSVIHIVLGGLLILAIVVSVGCMKKPEDKLLPKQAQKPVNSVQEKTIHLATDIYIPFEYQENNNVKGISVELVREVFRRMGYAVDIQVYPWARVLRMADSGEVDGVFSAFYSLDRIAYLDYTEEPLTDTVQSIFVMKGSNFQYDGTLESLKSGTIGIIRGYVYGETFGNAVAAGQIKVNAAEDCPGNIQKLVDGRIDGFIENQYSAKYYLKQAGLQDRVEELKPPFRSGEKLYLCFSRKRGVDPALYKAFDAMLKQMKNDGSYQAILKRYQYGP